jgi:hypothetical protein
LGDAKEEPARMPGVTEERAGKPPQKRKSPGEAEAHFSMGIIYQSSDPIVNKKVRGNSPSL